jgi:hypothetical protein
MPQLNEYTYPEAPINLAVDDIRLALTNAMDISTPRKRLNESVLLGMDAVFYDAIEERPLESEMPAIRIFHSVNEHNIENESGVVLWLNVSLNLYFLYYLGIGSTALPGESFQRMREQHIRWNLHHLKQRKATSQDTIGIQQAPNSWKWLPQRAVCDHDTPLKYLDSSIQIRPSSGFSCSRIDLSFMVRNYQSQQ